MRTEQITMVRGEEDESIFVEACALMRLVDPHHLFIDVLLQDDEPTTAGGGCPARSCDTGVRVD
jgi:hypothetical protein